MKRYDAEHRSTGVMETLAEAVNNAGCVAFHGRICPSCASVVFFPPCKHTGDQSVVACRESSADGVERIAYRLLEGVLKHSTKPGLPIERLFTVTPEGISEDDRTLVDRLNAMPDEELDALPWPLSCFAAARRYSRAVEHPTEPSV